MRHLGVLAHSTGGAALSFLSFCEEGHRRTGHNVHPDVSLDYIAFGYSLEAWDAGDHATVRRTLETSAARLAKADADFFICPDNTAHMALEVPGPDLPLPGLHIAEVVADQAQSQGYTRVGVLGTRFTMDSDLYPRMLAQRGISAVLPDREDRDLVDRVIFTELVNGVTSEASEADYLRIIGRLAATGCDAVALVCTEIPLLITAKNSPLPVLDSTRLLALAAYDVAVGEKPMPSWRGGPL
ncbi:aspartate/glutamate racemase family protein [Pseudonocardia alni]|uniref:aspartate/glutamate racemase family protein n=1 Tax=Pseudonocardia alni TaxID=33907 RepID=UPI00280BF0E9|nr:amino acid racemase [Pseudonocardia alni]